MTLYEYISDYDARRALAKALDTTTQWLWQIATRWRGKRPSPRLALAIERETQGEVTRYDLLPDIFGCAPEGASAPTAKEATNVSG